jgi:translation initiation factor 2B subunit (eIF-2B alpha/beta/delta family)
MNYREKVSDLFRSIENMVGTTDLNKMVMKALRRSIHDFREKDEEDFLKQFYELFETVKNTQPRIALVIDDFYQIWGALQKAKEEKHPEGHLYWERKILSTIKCFQKSARDSRKKIIKKGSEQVKKNDVILIHGISRTVLDILVMARRSGKKFRVIVAEQETEKTQQLIEILTSSQIRFQVVPEYMLSHIEAEVTKVFLGAVTVNSQLNVVADAGTNAIVSEFHLRHTPVYLFFSIRKFSLWASRSSHHTYKVKHIRTHTGKAKPITFERIKFSHDRIPLRLYDVFVTESGKMNADKIEALYKKKFAERESWRVEFFDEEEE